MLFAVTDDRTLLVLADLAQARREVESYDAESGDVAFYDDRGHALDVTFPHRERHKLLGMVLDDTPGPFELVQATGTRADLLGVLGSLEGLGRNPHFQALADVRQHIAAVRGMA